MTIRDRRAAVALIVVCVLFLMGPGLGAHLMTFKGTVLKVEPTRVQVKVLDDKGQEVPEPEWFTPRPATKILRGEKRVTWAEAKAEAGERIVVIVDHADDDTVTVVEIRLAAK